VELSMSLILVKLMVESFIEHINVVLKMIYFLVILSRYGEKVDAQISKNQIPLPMGISFFKKLHAFLYSSMCSLNPRKKYFSFL
jgi:hypothetical protein